MGIRILRDHPTAMPSVAGQADPRMPPPGTILERTFKGQKHYVYILQNGFEFRGRRYTSLSTIAGVITGSKWNGFEFFDLGDRREPDYAARPGRRTA